MTGRLVIIGGTPATGNDDTRARTWTNPWTAGDHQGRHQRGARCPFATADRDWSRQLGVAAYSALFAVAEGILAAGHGLILETNFRSGISDAPLRDRQRRARRVE